MFELLQVILNGLVIGSFYALMAIGLSLIYGMLGVANFAHGAVYMLGAFGAVLLARHFEISWWLSLLLVPLILAALSIVIERFLIQRLIKLPHVYNFLLTFGIALILQDLIRMQFGVTAQPFDKPALLSGITEIGEFRYPTYQLFVLVASILITLAVWFIINKTRIGAIVRASTERPELTRALGVNVSAWIVPVFAGGIFLAGLSGVMAAPMRAVNASMGAEVIIVLFAIVVIGGMGSMFGSVVVAFAIGVLQELSNLYLPQLSGAIAFIIMAIVLALKPSGVFGREEQTR